MARPHRGSLVVELVVEAEQMKMFLTRLGFGSKAVVNGDATQVDLQGGQSGLTLVEQILEGIHGISFVHLGGRDVVRHEIVQRIVEAYGRFGQQPLRSMETS